MKAYVVNHAGGPEVLEQTEVPTPQVKPGWSLVKVLGFGINHSEIFTREGQSPSVKFPRILGIEVAGEIAATSDEQKFYVGEKVVSIMGEMGRAFDGSYAEYVLLPDTQLYPVTTTLTIAKLAAVPETYYTAYGIFKSLQIKSSDEVLIRAATSGVGVAVLRLIKAFDGKIQVTGTTRSPQKEALLRKADFDAVIVAPNSQRLPQNTGKFDKIVDLIGPLSVPDTLQHLRPYGIENVTGELGGVWTLDNFEPITGIPNNAYLTSFSSGEVSPAAIQEMFAFIEKYHVDVKPAKVFNFSQVVEAHKYLEGQQGFGKVVVVL
ncbi:alcohol dehydrogenase catalytic domain-containing protein [Pediococcus siamensis]|uniref:alcohol dehydrogenase catalytic domain-containing protein n=1 Tax=Pediococcus siamensis TaxID=381829 RepID=UPI0039A27868